MADEIGYLETLALEIERQKPNVSPLVGRLLIDLAQIMLTEFESSERDGSGSAGMRAVGTQASAAVALLTAMAVSLPKEARLVTLSVITASALSIVDQLDADPAGSLDVTIIEARIRRSAK